MDYGFTSSTSTGDPLERRRWLPAYSLVFQVVSTSFLTLRLASRFQKRGGGLGLDDLFVVLGWIFATGSTILFIVGAFHFGFDRHSAGYTAKMALKSTLLGIITEVLYLIGAAFIKIGVLLFYRRLIQSSITRALRWAIWAAIIFTAAHAVTFLVLVFFECHPVEARWMIYDFEWAMSHKYKCNQHPAAIPLSGALSVFGDFYALAIPALLLSGLQMPRRQKVGLYFVFALGISVVVAGIVRTVYLDEIQKTMDVGWIAVNCMIASVAELHLAIICACAPSLKAVFQRFFSSRLTKNGSSNSQRSDKQPESAGTDSKSSSNNQDDDKDHIDSPTMSYRSTIHLSPINASNAAFFSLRGDRGYGGDQPRHEMRSGRSTPMNTRQRENQHQQQQLELTDMTERESGPDSLELPPWPDHASTQVFLEMTLAEQAKRISARAR